MYKKAHIHQSAFKHNHSNTTIMELAKTARDAARHRQKNARDKSWESDELGLQCEHLPKNSKEKLHGLVRRFVQVGLPSRHPVSWIFENVFGEPVPDTDVDSVKRLRDSYRQRCMNGMQKIRNSVRERGGRVGRWLCREGGDAIAFLGAFELHRRVSNELKDVLEVGLGIPDHSMVPIDVHHRVRTRFSSMDDVDVSKQFYVLAAMFVRDREVKTDFLKSLQPPRAPTRARDLTRNFGQLRDAPVPADKVLVVVRWDSMEGDDLWTYTVRAHINKIVTLPRVQEEIAKCADEEGYGDFWRQATSSASVTLALCHHTLEFWKTIHVGLMRNSPRLLHVHRCDFTLRENVQSEVPIKVQGVSRSGNVYTAERVVTPADVDFSWRLPYILYDKMRECLADVALHMDSKPVRYSVYNPATDSLDDHSFRGMPDMTILANSRPRHLSNMRESMVDLWPIARLFRREAGVLFDVYRCVWAYGFDQTTLVVKFL